MRHNLPNDTDIRVYDAARLWVGTQSASEGVLGELWVTYDVTLMIPQKEEKEAIQWVGTEAGDPGHITDEVPLGPVTSGTIDHYISTVSHSDMDKFEFVDNSRNGYLDAIAFRQPGSYLINYALQTVSSWVTSPQGLWTTAQDREGIAYEDIVDVWNAATQQYSNTTLVDVPWSAFPNEIYHGDVPVEDCPRLIFSGAGDFAASVLQFACSQINPHELIGITI